MPVLLSRRVVPKGKHMGYEPNLPPGVLDELISGGDDGDTEYVGGDAEGCLGCSVRAFLVVVAIAVLLTVLVYAANSCSTL